MTQTQAEIHFDKCAKLKMINYNGEDFKRTHKRLYEAIIAAIRTAKQ